MNKWYYAHGGEQKGPVPVSELQRLASVGDFNPATDMVWRDGMADWKPAHTVEELAAAFGSTSSDVGATPAAASAHPAATDDVNPYAAPASLEPAAPSATLAGSDLQEIEPGSDPLQVGTCISRGFDLMKANLGMVIAVVVIFGGISWAVSMVLSMIEGVAGGGFQLQFDVDPITGELEPRNAEITPVQVIVIFFTNLINNIVSVFLGLGMVRIGLNIVDGKPFDLGMLFGEAGKLVRGFLAGLLYGLAVGLGLLLLIVPGIYIALRWGQYQNAIVDRDMGILESFSYSSHITQGQKWPLLGLAVLSFLIVLAGIIALCVGVIFAYPIVWLAGLVAYRWMQYGSAVCAPRG